SDNAARRSASRASSRTSARRSCSARIRVVGSSVLTEAAPRQVCGSPPKIVRSLEQGSAARRGHLGRSDLRGVRPRRKELVSDSPSRKMGEDPDSSAILPMSTIREVPYGSPLYYAVTELRRELLRRPLGLDFTPEELAREK